ncbi:MAG: hypothetical protein ACKVPY_07385 [Paracoccaceae bacterium]
MAYENVRPDADEWVAAKGPEGIRAFWADKNRATIDSFPTGMLE